MNTEAIKKAIDELVALVEQEEDTLVGLEISPDPYNPDSWVVYAVKRGDTFFHYAAYVSSDGAIVVDGL
jgi:hypothetical protein